MLDAALAAAGQRKRSNKAAKRERPSSSGRCRAQTCLPTRTATGASPAPVAAGRRREGDEDSGEGEEVEGMNAK